MLQVALYSFLCSFSSVPMTSSYYMTLCFNNKTSSVSISLCKAMATVVNFPDIAPCQTPCQRTLLKPTAGPPIGSLPIKRTCKFVQQSRADAKKHSTYVKNQAENKLSSIRALLPIMAAKGNSTFSSGSLSPSETINDFYKCINEKNLKQLSHYISTDCYIEECSFSTPLQDKKVIIIYLFLFLTTIRSSSSLLQTKAMYAGNNEVL